jgi:septal ring factor EnvC (AmiA/AmiB activator)
MNFGQFLAKAERLLGLAEKGLDSTAIKEIDTLKADLAREQENTKALNETVASLTKENTDLTAKVSKMEADATALIAAHTAALEAKEKEVDGRASAKALEIAAAQGIPPVKEPANDNPQAGAETYESVQAQMAAETDPEKKAALGIKCRKLRGHGEKLF